MFWSAFQHQAYEPITKCFIVLFIFNFFTLVWSQLHMSLYCVLLSLSSSRLSERREEGRAKMFLELTTTNYE